MGNQACGSECSVLLDQHLKVPLNAVNRDYNNFQFIEFNDFFQYPSRFPYILSYLRKNQLFFQDIYFPTNQTRMIIGPSIIKAMGSDLDWMRINDILQRPNIKFIDPLFAQSAQKYKESPQLYRFLHWVTSIPKLMLKIFRFQMLTRQGLVLLYFPLWGSHDQPAQVVIDDFIPVTSQKSYYFYMPQINNVAMVLLQKGLAKYFGSYQRLRELPLKDLFQVVVGLPIMIENVGTKDQVEIFSRYYKPHFDIKSYNKRLENHQPEYFRFSLDHDSNMAISLWQQLEDQHTQERVLPAQIVMQLMLIQNENKVVRVGYSSKLYKDKTLLRNSSPEEQKTIFMGNQFLLLPRGNYLLHIYTKTDNVSANSNLITYSDHNLILTYRKDSAQLSLIKKKMIQSIFLKHNRDLEKCMFTERVYSKFVWDGFRGILAFKNEEESKVKITILIKEEYRKKIKFQDSQFLEEQFTLKPYSKKIISFVKLIDADVGNFYSQNTSYVKNAENMSPGNSFPTSISFKSQVRQPIKEYRQEFATRQWDELSQQSNPYTPSSPVNPYIQ